MRNRQFSVLFSVALATLFLTACSSQQIYTTGQNYQRNQCQQLPNQTDRERCLERTGGSYDGYQREQR